MPDPLDEAQRQEVPYATDIYIKQTKAKKTTPEGPRKKIPDKLQLKKILSMSGLKNIFTYRNINKHYC